MTVAAKHFPGDGSEERDRHFVIGCNDFSVDEWEDTFGRDYRGLIGDGVETVMVGHITQRALSKKYRPDCADADIKPATLAPKPREKYVGCIEHNEFRRETAEKCNTLVKDTQHLLPVSPEGKRVFLIYAHNIPNSRGYNGDPVKNMLIEELERAGFTVDVCLHILRP